MGWAIDILVGNIYLKAFLILITCIIIAKFTFVVFKLIVYHMLKKSKLKQSVVLKIETPIIVVIILAGFELAIQAITNSTNLFENFIDSVIIFVIAYMFIAVIKTIITYWAKAHNNKHKHKEFHGEMLPLIKSLSKILLLGIATLMTLQIWGVQVGALLASLGIMGIILGFAFQDSLKNIFGGISLTTDNSLNKGDIIKLDSGEVGEVIEITLRSTKIKTFDDDFLIVPNGQLSNSTFHNYAQPTPTVRITIPINVAYGSDVKKVKEVLLETIKGREDILLLPPRDVRFMKMDDYSLKFDFIFFISNYPNRFTMIDEVTTLAYDALRNNNIEIPFPTRTIYSK